MRDEHEICYRSLLSFWKRTFWSSKDLDDHSACHAHVWPLDMWVLFWEYSQSLKSLITNIHKQDRVGWYRLLEMDHVTCPCFFKKTLVWHLWWYVANALDSIRFGLPTNTLEDDEKKLEDFLGEISGRAWLTDTTGCLMLFGDEARKLWDKINKFRTLPHLI